MSFPLTCERISEVLGPAGPIDNVRANWPVIEAALVDREIHSDRTCVAAIATVGIETGVFAPVKERGGPTYLGDLYDGRKDLGNTQPGDGARFRGRGFIQITGRWDYEHFGEEIHRDLIGQPDLALDPRVAAEILAVYFRERQVDVYADAQKWEVVRRRVNGGLAGWPRFIQMVTNLVSAVREIPPLPPAPIPVPEGLKS